MFRDRKGQAPRAQILAEEGISDIRRAADSTEGHVIAQRMPQDAR